MIESSPSMRRRPVIALVVALGLVVAACGAEGQPAGTEAGVDSLASVDESGRSDGSSPDRNGDGILQIGIFGECEGAFGAYNEDVVAGASLAFIERAGAVTNSRTTALEGFTGATVAGTEIELVGIGCGDDTAIRAVQEVQWLVEELGSEIVFGPVSGDEGVAVANYALLHPDVLFLSGSSGAQDATLRVKAPNFFRFSGDGAQFNAGLGDMLHNVAGWETAAVIADDYTFGWTSAAGFIAEFCAAGGKVVSRTFPRLGMTDYDAIVDSLPDPDEVDGYFWAVGGTGTESALRSFMRRKGPIDGANHAGNLFFNPGLADVTGPDIVGAYYGGSTSLAPDVRTPAIEAFEASADAVYDSLRGGLGGGRPAPASEAIRFGFGYAYYVSGIALIEAMEATDGSVDPVVLAEAIAGLELDAPFGPLRLDENRQGVVTSSVQQLVMNDAGEVVAETVAIIPEVEQSFGGRFTADSPPPGRDQPACLPGPLPWLGHAVDVVDGIPQRP